MVGKMFIKTFPDGKKLILIKEKPINRRIPELLNLGLIVSSPARRREVIRFAAG